MATSFKPAESRIRRAACAPDILAGTWLICEYAALTRHWAYIASKMAGAANNKYINTVRVLPRKVFQRQIGKSADYRMIKHTPCQSDRQLPSNWLPTGRRILAIYPIGYYSNGYIWIDSSRLPRRHSSDPGKAIRE
jgi:hypothetical protein